MMRWIAMLFVLVTLSVVAPGCNQEKVPEADPNFKRSDNPSDITVPDSMRKVPPAAPAGSAPAAKTE